MSTVSQTFESFSFDNSFSSFSENQPQTSLSFPFTQMNSIISSLEEIEEFLNMNIHEEREINSIFKTFTTIISKCTEIQNSLQSKLNHFSEKLSVNNNDEIFQYFEQALTPKFSFNTNQNFNFRKAEHEFVSFCDDFSPSSSECSSLNSSIMVENIHIKTLLKTVKEIQDKGIITQTQKKFLKEKIISKDREFYSFISNNENNNNNIDLSRAIRTYLKQFKLMK